MPNPPDLDDYVDVRQRMVEFFDLYPEGSFQSECQFTQVDGRWVTIVKAYAYRHPEDPKPGTGLAYEFIPALTTSGKPNPYVKDSELQNAETAAWGRAVIAVGASDSKKPIASRQEVRNRTADNVTQMPNNAEGREALGKLCEEKRWDKEKIAQVFTEKYKKAPRLAPNEDLNSFINLIRSGALVIDLEPQPA